MGEVPIGKALRRDSAKADDEIAAIIAAVKNDFVMIFPYLHPTRQHN
jgi:hypothetical protein